MSPMGPIALFGMIPATLVLFALLPPRRAVLVAFLVGWLFRACRVTGAGCQNCAHLARHSMFGSFFFSGLYLARI